MELQQLSDGELLRVKNNYYNEEMNQLSNSLMALEFQLVSQLEVGVFNPGKKKTKTFIYVSEFK